MVERSQHVGLEDQVQQVPGDTPDPGEEPVETKSDEEEESDDTDEEEGEETPTHA
jgi:hypothetical protein